jgi:hypothetical protein
LLVFFIKHFNRHEYFLSHSNGNRGHSAKMSFTLGFCLLNFSIAVCPSVRRSKWLLFGQIWVYHFFWLDTPQKCHLLWDFVCSIFHRLRGVPVSTRSYATAISCKRVGPFLVTSTMDISRHNCISLTDAMEIAIYLVMRERRGASHLPPTPPRAHGTRDSILSQREQVPVVK